MPRHVMNMPRGGVMGNAMGLSWDFPQGFHHYYRALALPWVSHVACMAVPLHSRELGLGWYANPMTVYGGP